MSGPGRMTFFTRSVPFDPRCTDIWYYASTCPRNQPSNGPNNPPGLRGSARILRARPIVGSVRPMNAPTAKSRKTTDGRVCGMIRDNLHTGRSTNPNPESRSHRRESVDGYGSTSTARRRRQLDSSRRSQVPPISPRSPGAPITFTSSISTSPDMGIPRFYVTIETILNYDDLLPHGRHNS
jgi:hypothetical protein